MSAELLAIFALALSGALWSAGLLLFGWTGPWADVAVFAILVGLARTRPQPLTHRPRAWLAIAVAAAALIVAALFLEQCYRNPDGGWDAVAIWNLRARALYGAPHDLALVFTPELPAQHPDYPLLLPGLVAHLWFLIGSRTQVVPIAISFVFAACCVIALGRRAGLPAALLLLGTPELLALSCSQYADVEVATLVLVAVMLASEERWLAAGVAAGLCAYTKNEGLVWLVTLLAAVAITSGRQAAVRVLAGAAAPLALLAYFKIRWAPVNDLVARTSAADLVHRAPRRLLLVLRGFALQITDFGKWGATLPAGLVLFVVCFRRNVPSLFCVLSLAALFGIYLVTPHNPVEHMASSLDRLLFQLWPALLFAASRPAQTISAPQPAQSPSTS